METNDLDNSENSEEKEEKHTLSREQIIEQKNKEFLEKNASKTLQTKGLINLYIRRDMIIYLTIFKKIIEAEEAEIKKTLNKSPTKKVKRGGVMSLGVSKLIKNYVEYKKLHKDEKLLDVSDFVSDGRKDNL